MKPFTTHTGTAVAIDRVDIDTDQIVPARFLRRIERTGFGQYLFNNWRFTVDGTLNPNFILNKPEYEGSSVLIAGRNFGTGSSREHAAWALSDYGFRCIIAPSFADIFQKNCFDNGLVPVHVSESLGKELITKASTPGYQVTVDLELCQLRDREGLNVTFSVHKNPKDHEFKRHCLLNGLDDIGLALQHENKISAFESRRKMK